MTTYQNPRSTRANASGFTLVEVLVTITIIAILAGMLSVAVSRALIRAQEFAIQNEMMQIEASLEKFNIEYGFYPPSFKNMSVGDMQAFLARIAPNNSEATLAPQDSMGRTRIQYWWDEVGAELANAGNNPGADLVFWLSGLAKNKQFPLSNPATGVPLAAHNYNTADNNFERQEFFEFETGRINAGGLVSGYSLSDRNIPLLYLDAPNYLPSGAGADDGAYCRPGFSDEDYMEITEGTLVFGSQLFKEIYPNPDKFQLVGFGLDGLPGQSDAPNNFTRCGSEGADNFVNFGGEGIIKLETVVLESN